MACFYKIISYKENNSLWHYYVLQINREKEIFWASYQAMIEDDQVHCVVSLENITNIIGYRSILLFKLNLRLTEALKAH